tara:strand:- start:32 stop:235 length:204 start_codon:yes stop_codon:yes gene_type:complete
MEVESDTKWSANTVNFILEDNIYLRLTPHWNDEHNIVIWYKAIAGDKFHHVIDDTKLNAAWEAHEIQ